MIRPRVAVIDSGINPHHSHVQAVRDGISLQLAADGTIVATDDWRDRVGHGTAVAGAIRLFAPEADLLAVNVIDPAGRASADQLAAAIAWSVEHQARIINLSLGTTNPDHVGLLQGAVQQAIDADCLVVSAAPSNGRPMWPAHLPDVIGVLADDRLAPHDVGLIAEAQPPWRAHGRPRPLPGAAQTRNYQGSSFAAARISGMLAHQAGQSPEASRAELLAWLTTHAVRLNPSEAES